MRVLEGEVGEGFMGCRRGLNMVNMLPPVGVGPTRNLDNNDWPARGITAAEKGSLPLLPPS